MICIASHFSTSCITKVAYSVALFTEESDEEDEPPSRRRRMAERAAEGGEGEEEVCHIILSYHKWLMDLKHWQWL